MYWSGAEETKWKIEEEKWKQNGKVLSKDSDNGEKIILKRKKGYIQKNSVMEKKRKQNLRLEEIVRDAVLKLEENVRKGKKRK